jgi:hypothetical protein
MNDCSNIPSIEVFQPKTAAHRRYQWYEQITADGCRHLVGTAHEIARSGFHIGIDELARRLQSSEATARRERDELIKRGHLVSIRGRGIRGKEACNRYGMVLKPGVKSDTPDDLYGVSNLNPQICRSDTRHRVSTLIPESPRSQESPKTPRRGESQTRRESLTPREESQREDKDLRFATVPESPSREPSSSTQSPSQAESQNPRTKVLKTERIGAETRFEPLREETEIHQLRNDTTIRSEPLPDIEDEFRKPERPCSQKKRYWVKRKWECKHSRVMVMEYDEVDAINSRPGETKCDICGEFHRGFVEITGEYDKRRERDQRNMAAVKRGCELFKPIQQVEDTRAVPVDFHETLQGNRKPESESWDGPLDDEEERSSVDWDAIKREAELQYRNDPERPEYRQYRNEPPPPNDEPDDYDPNDYASLCAAE